MSINKTVWISILFLFAKFVMASDVQKDIPGTPEGAQKLLNMFVKPDADIDALNESLRPDKADFKVYFKSNSVDKAYKGYTQIWDNGWIKVKPKAGQTEVLVYQATTNDIRQWRGMAKAEFPGGYQKVADKLNDNVVVYKFRFVEPGKSYGMAFDGLTYINGRWVIFPKPYLVLR